MRSQVFHPRSVGRPMSRRGSLVARLALTAFLSGAAPARADQPVPGVTLEELRARLERLEKESDERAASPPPVTSRFQLQLGGYGDLQFAYHGFGTNQNRQGGSQRDSRLVFDDARFVLKVVASLPFDFQFESEIEFEHGGTAISQELDYEEFGEFEQEVEKGGEVLLEEFQLERRFGEHVTVGLGRIYVAVGLLGEKHRPGDYLGTIRSEAEATVIPTVWDELGLQVKARFRHVAVTAQLVNGLDSTAFSSQGWVGTGQQTRFELVRATDLAVVGRVDFLPHGDDVVIGLSAYAGGTSRNRPKADLVRECAEANLEVVAPCGYVDAPVVLGDVHARFRWGPLRGRALALLGYLHNADSVSRRNERLSNALQVLRSPVADQAYAVWGELGLDVAPWLTLAPTHRLEPFVRIDHYDTMFGVRAGLFDNPRFERSVLTAGVSYTLHDTVVLKLDASRRWFGTSAFNPEDSIRLAAGFSY